MKKLWKTASLLLTPILVLGLQFGNIGLAHAAGNAELSISSDIQYSNTGFYISIYNSQDSDTISEFTINNIATNATLEDGFIDAVPLQGADPGSFNTATNTWTGSLEPGDTISILYKIHVTTPVGSTVSITSNIVSSKLVGGAVNVDTTLSNDTATSSFIETLHSDLNVSTRLKTTGTILETTDVTYEVTIENAGLGEYVDKGFFYLVFIMPEDSTFVSMTDTNLSDEVEVNQCNNIGPIENLGFVALNSYSYTGNLMLCPLGTTANLPSGTNYKFEFTMTAGPVFAAGNASVLVLGQGNDVDTLKIWRALAFQTDPFADDTGNFVFLSYDPSELSATSSLCPGQSAISNDGNGCFSISFNKDIYDESFGLDDIVVTGSGTASSLTKVGDNLWELRIVNIGLGQTANISLNTGGIIDLSAVQSAARVLGITAIRYEIAVAQDTTSDTLRSASGTLAETGTSSSNMLTALTLMFTGFALLLTSKYRKKNIV